MHWSAHSAIYSYLKYEKFQSRDLHECSNLIIEEGRSKIITFIGIFLIFVVSYFILNLITPFFIYYLSIYRALYTLLHTLQMTAVPPKPL